MVAVRSSAWEWVVGINLYGVVHGIRAFLPIMQDQGEGHIVNTASMAGLVALPGAAAYNATKTAVRRGQRGPVPRAAQHRLARRRQRALSRVREDEPDGQTSSGSSVSAHEPAGRRSTRRQDDRDDADAGRRRRHRSRRGRRAGARRGPINDRFWILTHPEMRHAPVERMLRAEAQENPA